MRFHVTDALPGYLPVAYQSPYQALPGESLPQTGGAHSEGHIRLSYALELGVSPDHVAVRRSHNNSGLYAVFRKRVIRE